jgi:exosortase/archaeosortase family protein
MTRRDIFWLSGLAALGAWIWVRDLAWWPEASDTLPILAALPLFAWLGAPWHWSKIQQPTSRLSVLSGGVLLLAGTLGDLTLLLALGWTLLLWAWLQPKVEASQLGSLSRLMVLPVLAFPWIASEGQTLGWWFRLSAAATAETIFAGIGLSVARAGTNFVVQGAPIAVAPACAGLGTLQAMLLAGCALAFIYFGRDGGPRYWLSLPALVLMSWLTNTLRVMVIAVVAVSFGPAFAAGTFHQLEGLGVILTMFCLCVSAFTLLRHLSAASGAHPA